MSITIFVAGTDTDAGKTYISCGLLRAFTTLGWTTLGIKPVASGCRLYNGRLENPDTLLLQQASSERFAHEDVTPFAFEAPISPNIAAAITRRSLSVKQLNQQLVRVLAHPARARVMEGCGGWHVPLNDCETMADFVLSNRFPVLLVVGMRLGCLNHAQLTLRSMLQANINVLGWVGNCITPEMLNRNENISYLKRALPVPCAGIVEHGARPEDNIDIRMLLSRLHGHAHQQDYQQASVKSLSDNGCIAR